MIGPLHLQLWLVTQLHILSVVLLKDHFVDGACFNLSFSPVDLSHFLDDDTVSWNKSVKFQLIDRIAHYISNDTFYAANNFKGAEHSGTHIDAPYHFNKNGSKVADIPLNFLINSGVMVNVSSLVDEGDFLLMPEHLDTWEKQNGKIKDNVIMLINFGWSSRYKDRVKYFGAEDPPYNFPGISTEAAKWIVENKNINGVGVDTPSVDYGKSTTFPVHAMFSEANIFGLENVDLFNKSLPAKDFQLIVMPMKIREGSGAPCRIVAVQ